MKLKWNINVMQINTLSLNLFLFVGECCSNGNSSKDEFVEGRDKSVDGGDESIEDRDTSIEARKKHRNHVIFGLRMRRECRERPARVVKHVGIANARWRGKRSRHSRRMRNPQFCVSGKRPMHVLLAMRGMFEPEQNPKRSKTPK